MASFIPTSSSPKPKPTSPSLRSNLAVVRVHTQKQAHILGVLQDDLDEKMDQLEAIKADLNMVDVQIPETASVGRPVSRASSLSPISSGLSPLGGITIEHRMLADLRSQLEKQASENKKLRRQIESSTPRQSFTLTGLEPVTTPTVTYGTAPRSFSGTHGSDYPSVRETVESILARGTRRSPIETVPVHSESATEVLLRKQLVDAQAEITLLKERLRKNESSCEQQRSQFRSAVEELQSRLNETIIGRDSVLELRKREVEGQEKTIAQLQQSLKHLNATNIQHEKNILAANQRAESLQHTATSTSTALQQIRTLLASTPLHTQGRLSSPPRPGAGEGSGRAWPPSHVVRLVEEVLRDGQDRVLELERASADWKRELSAVKKESEEKTRGLNAETREKLVHLSEEHDKQLAALTERAANARQQATGLQAQLAALQEQSTKQISLKTMELTTLGSQYESLKRDGQTERQQLQQKIEELTSDLDANRNDMQAAREEISKLQLKLADASLTLQTNKENLVGVQAELRAEQEKTGQLRSQEGQRLTNVQRELQARSLEVRHLQELLGAQREEARAELRQRLSEVQCEEQKKALDKMSKLLADIEALRAENGKLSLETQRLKADCDQSNQNRDGLASMLDDTSARLQAAQNGQQSMQQQLEEKTRSMEILTTERDRYRGLYEERMEDLDAATSLQKKLESQVTQREYDYQTICEQKINLARLVESNEVASADVRRERENLVKLLDEKSKEVAVVSGQKDDLAKKLKVREKKVQSLEMEVKTMAEGLQEKTEEVEKVIEGKAGLLEELKTLQHKVTLLTHEKAALEAQSSELEKTRDKTNGHLQLRIQGLEHDLHLTLQALRATKATDQRAVSIADGLQQELSAKRTQADSLRNRIHTLEESLSAAHKEKALLQAERELQEEQCSRLKEQLELLQGKARSLAGRRSSQKDVVSRLEAALEKASLKHTDAQHVIEEQEQAIAKMSLKHQLEIKALQRTLASKQTPHPQHPHHPATPPAPTPGQGGLTTTTTTTTTRVEEKIRASRLATTATLTKVQSARPSDAPAGAELAPYSGSTPGGVPAKTGTLPTPTGGVVAPQFLQGSGVQVVEGVVGQRYVGSVPVVVLNTSGTQLESRLDHLVGESEHNVSSELKELLQEVKSVFSANVAALKTATYGQRKDMSHSTPPVKSSSQDVDYQRAVKSTNGTLRFSPGEPSSLVPELDVSPSKSEDIVDPPLHTSSPYPADITGQHSSELESHSPPRYDQLKLTRDLQRGTSSSPVSNLLGLHRNTQSDSALHFLRMQVKKEPASAVFNKGGRAWKNESRPTRSYSGNRPKMPSGSDAKAQHTKETAGVGTVTTPSDSTVRAPSYHDFSEKPVAGLTNAASNVSHQSRSNVKMSVDGGSDFSVPLRIEVPEPAEAKPAVRTEHKRRGGGRTVEKLNRRNREDVAEGQKVTERELIISDEDSSSLTSVTSVSAGSLNLESPDQKDSLKGLRDRLAVLSRMGNQLQKGNKEMAGLIKLHDVKLKHCRQKERHAKRIMNAK